MFETLSNIFSIFSSSQFWYFLIFLFTFLESLFLIGVLIPGIIFVVFGGMLVSSGHLSFFSTFAIVVLGAVLGDLLSFYLGKRGKNFVKKDTRFLKIDQLKKAEVFFEKHGGKSIFLGRFSGPFRCTLPFAAGLARMNFRRFLIWDILSAICWAFIYVFIGLSVGQAYSLAEIWVTRSELVLLALFIFFIIFYFLHRFLSRKKRESLFPFLSSLKKIANQKIAQSKKIKIFKKKHPGFFAFVSDRFSGKNFFGSKFTLITTIFLLTAFTLFGVISDLAYSSRILEVDQRVSNLLYIFRDLDALRFFYFVTLLANWQSIVVFSAATVVILVINNKKSFILPLIAVLIGQEITKSLAKSFFERPRPDVLIFPENTFSFPSGHSSVAVLFYGFVAYLLLKMTKNKIKRLDIVVGFLMLIFLIAFSRLYLGYHFFSDVLGGVLFGFLWLLIAVCVAEWRLLKEKQFSLGIKDSKKITIGILVGVLSFYLIFSFINWPVFKYSRSEKIYFSSENPEALFRSNKLDKFTETIRGNKQEPISFVIQAKNGDQLKELFKLAGWYETEPLNRTAIGKLITTAVFNQSYPTAPMTPFFWQRQVHDFGFQKPTNNNTIRERHHVRFWETNIVLANSKKIYVGIASLDTGIKWFITHRISPNIDWERDYLFKDLLNSGMVKDWDLLKVVNPMQGKNFSGDPFFTDGKGYFIELK